MRKVILQEFVSIDGRAAEPGGSVDLVTASVKDDKSFGDSQLELLQSIDTILLGRVTYEMFSAYWPNVTEGDEKKFADLLNATPKVVFSKTLRRAPWGTWAEARIVRGAAGDEVAQLRQGPGRAMILWGSLSVAQSLIDAGLVDEYRLVICPVVLPNGRPLFRDGRAPLGMNLREARITDRGALDTTYVRR